MTLLPTVALTVMECYISQVKTKYKQLLLL